MQVIDITDEIVSIKSDEMAAGNGLHARAQIADTAS